MGKIAFVFAGQGAQYPGMGADLYAGSEQARRVFELADSVRPGTSQLCFNGSAAELGSTINTQPCLYALDYACAALAREELGAPDMCAGFSLGEVAAAAFCGMTDFETGFRLVCRRAELMQRCAEQHPGRMYAVVKLDAPTVDALCAGVDQAYPVNYNSPLQTVVACAESSADALCAAVKAAGGRAIRLNVSGAFHSPYMSDAAAGLREYLSGIELSAPNVPLYANLTGEPYAAGSEAETLARQCASPVKWVDTVRNMIAAGADTFVECGAGNTLCGLIQKIAPEVKTLRAGKLDEIRALRGGEN